VILDWLTFLDAHNGAVIAIATVVYVTLTFFLLLQARAGRVVHDKANLEAYPRPWGTMYVALDFENYGPAVARNCRLKFWISEGGSSLAGTERVHAEPLFPVGFRRRFLISATDAKIESLHELADRNAVLHGEWHWEDGRQRWWRRQTVHRKTFTHVFSELKEGFYGGASLRERDAEEEADRNYDELKKLRTAVEKMTSIMEGPAMKLWIQELAAERQAAAVEAALGTGDGKSEAPLVKVRRTRRAAGATRQKAAGSS
jgi:hypothetical protein